MTFEDDFRARTHSLAQQLHAEIGERLEQLVRNFVDEADQERDAATRGAQTSVQAAVASQLGWVLAAADARAEEDLTAAKVGGRQAQLAETDRLLLGMRRFDRSDSLADVLDALVETIEREVARVAVWVVRGERIRGWSAAGFGDECTNLRRLEASLVDAGILTQAIRTRERATSSDSASAEPSTSSVLGQLMFLPLPANRVGLAVPLEVGGEVVAAVYADNCTGSEQLVPSAWPEVVEILTRHASMRLEILALARALTSSAPASAVSAQGSEPPAAVSADGDREEQEELA